MGCDYLLLNLFAGISVNELLHRFESSYTKKILLEAVDLFNQLWPYVILGIFLSTIIKIYISKTWFINFFKNRSNSSILIASLFGVLSPLGSYVVIPIAAALTITGVPVYILMAFLVSSPIINPSLFTLTAGAFNLEMALARALSAFIIGISAGYITKWMMNSGKLNVTDLVNKNYRIINYDAVNESKMTLTLFLKEMYRFAVFISKFFFLSILLAAIIKILVSPNYIVRIFSPNSILSVIISTGAGVPFYVCGGAAIPVVQSLAELGLQKGAVLAYFISGPVTKISNLVIMNSAFNFKLFLVYLTTGIVGAIVFGILYNII